MNNRSLLALTFTLSLLAISPALRAQDAAVTFRPTFVESTAFAYSYSGKSAYKDNAAPGESSVQHFEASIGARAMLGKATIFHYGAAFALNDIDSDAGVPAPERLGELSLNLGLTQLISKKWRASVFTRPGYYGDLEHYTTPTINVPVMAMAMYSPSEKYTWLLGLSVNPFSEYIVMPVLTFRWAFAEKWTFNLGFPRLGLMWQATEKLELSLFGTAQGGGYRTTKAPNNTARTDLADTYVNYRELRMGVRAAYKIAQKTSLAVEGGWMANREFDYYDRDYKLKGKSAAYLTIALDVKM